MAVTLRRVREVGRWVNPMSTWSRTAGDDRTKTNGQPRSSGLT